LIFIIISIFSGFILTLIVSLLFLFLKQRTPVNILPYRDLRGELINQAKKGRLPSSATHRPSNLDTRVNSAVSQRMRAFNTNPPTNAKQRVALFRLFTQVIDSIHEELDAIGGGGYPVDLIAEPRRVVFTVYWFESEINNGGFDQWYLNLSGSTACDAPEALRTLGFESIAGLVERANMVFPNQPPRDRTLRLSQMDDISESDSELWDTLSTEFYESDIDCQSVMIRYILENESHFFLSD